MSPKINYSRYNHIQSPYGITSTKATDVKIDLDTPQNQ